MLPIVSPNGMPSHRSRNAILAGDLCIANSASVKAFTHFSYEIFRQFGHMTFFSLWCITAVLAVPVLNIVHFSAKEIMKWITAFSEVALMAYTCGFWNGAKSKGIRHPVYIKRKAFYCGNSISSSTYCAAPFPAFICSNNIHLGPKFSNLLWSKLRDWSILSSRHRVPPLNGCCGLPVMLTIGGPSLILHQAVSTA